MENKKLIIFGGFYQNEIIVDKANKNNIHTIVIDNIVNSPAKNISRENYLISIKDVDLIVDLFNKIKADGIMNYCIDPGQKPYAQACEKLGLKSYGSIDQFNILSNKDIFLNLCKEHQLGVIDKYSEFEINSSFKDYPIVVKPVDGRASKGVRVCYDRHEFDRHINNAKEASDSGKVIIEKYVDGCEVCAKYFVINGKVYLTSFSDTYSVFEEGQKVSIIGKRFPSIYLDKFLESEDSKIRYMIESIGVKNGPISITGFYENDSFSYFDPSFRLGGAQQWRVEEAMSGFDKSFALTQFALNSEINEIEDNCEIETHKIKKYGAIAYIILKLGKIKTIQGVQQCSKLDSVVGYCYGHKEGDTVTQKGTTDQVLVFFHLVSESMETIKKDINTINATVKAFDDNGNDMIFAKFDPSLL